VSEPASKPAHVSVETVLGRTLAAAVLLSAAIAVAGGVLFLQGHGRERADFSVYAPQAPELSQPRSILGGALHGAPTALMQLGIFILVLTPVARVAFSLVLFAMRRDRMYTIITLAVLAVLLAGLLGAVA
jgi:uncharacterized membrane protein